MFIWELITHLESAPREMSGGDAREHSLKVAWETTTGGHKRIMQLGCNCGKSFWTHPRAINTLSHTPETIHGRLDALESGLASLHSELFRIGEEAESARAQIMAAYSKAVAGQA